MPKIIPFGDRILCKRRKVGEKIGKEGVLYASEQMRDAKTDLADVVFVPELTYGDKHILSNAEKIIGSLVAKAMQGDDEALIACMRINEFVKMKSLKPGDVVMISKYVGTTFSTSDMQEELVLVLESDIIGLVRDDDPTSKV